MSVNQAHALKCFKPKELFNINTNAAFVKMKPKDPDESGEESEDDEQEMQDLLMDDGRFKLSKQKPELHRLDLSKFDASKFEFPS